MMENRYILQMSEFQAYKLALYDTELWEVVAQFKHADTAEAVKLYLNSTASTQNNA